MTLGVWHQRDSSKAGTEATVLFLLLITLWPMALGVWHERDSIGKWGGGGEEGVGICGDFHKLTRDLKIEERYPILVSKSEIKREIFVMEFRGYFW